MRNKLTATTAALLIGIAASVAEAQRPREILQKVDIERDVEYGKAGDRALLLDMVKSKDPSAEKLPAVVFIHGGGWRSGDKRGGIGRVAPLVATGNYVGFSIGYRLSGEAIWPAQIHDCKAAIRWIRDHAEALGVDPEKIGVWGSSAGGHLVSLLGTSGDVSDLEGTNGTPDVSSRVTCVVDFCGPSDFLTFGPHADEKDSAPALFLGGPVSEKKEAAKQASPATYVSGDDPPFLIVHGTKDPLVRLGQATTFHEKLEKAGVDSTLLLLEGGGHGIGGPDVHERVRAFFDKHLRGQDVEVSDEPIKRG